MSRLSFLIKKKKSLWFGIQAFVFYVGGIMNTNSSILFPLSTCFQDPSILLGECITHFLQLPSSRRCLFPFARCAGWGQSIHPGTFRDVAAEFSHLSLSPNHVTVGIWNYHSPGQPLTDPGTSVASQVSCLWLRQTEPWRDLCHRAPHRARPRSRLSGKLCSSSFFPCHPLLASLFCRSLLRAPSQ